MPIFSHRIAAAALLLVIGTAHAQAPATVRLDYIHSGNALSEQYAIERVLIEPLPWPGDMARPFDDTNRGNNRVEVADAKTGDLLYSRDFSTVFGEWKTTAEASQVSRGSMSPCACAIRHRSNLKIVIPFCNQQVTYKVII
jgi:hypothetical protein